MTGPASPDRTRRLSRRLARLVTLAAVPAAVAVSGLVVSQASYSAYSATTVDPDSNWATGTVAPGDDDANTAAFDVAEMTPGATGTRCIAVTSTGGLPSAVKLYVPTRAAPRTGVLHRPHRHPRQRRVVRLLLRLHAAGDRRHPLHREPGGVRLLRHQLRQRSGQLDPGRRRGRDPDVPLHLLHPRPAGPDSTQGGTASGGLTWEAQHS